MAVRSQTLAQALAFRLRHVDILPGKHHLLVAKAGILLVLDAQFDFLEIQKLDHVLIIATCASCLV